MFLAVLDTGSTLQASKTLGMAQPTVARRIEALEHALGLSLFERDTRGYRVTPDGAAIANAARGVGAAVSTLEEVVQVARSAHDGPIRITTTLGVFNNDMTQMLGEFQDKHPGQQFDLMTSVDHLDIGAGEADIAIRVAPVIEDETLICRKLFELSAGLFAGKAYAERHDLPAEAAELGAHRFLIYRGKAIPKLMNDWLLNQIRPDQIATSCEDPNTMMAALTTGVGIGPLPTLMGRRNPDLIECFQLPASVDTPIWFLVNPTSYRRPIVKAFTGFAADRLAASMKRRAAQQQCKSGPT